MAKVKTTGIKAIALSGYGEVADKRKSGEAGFLTHLTKPVSVEELESMIERILI